MKNTTPKETKARKTKEDKIQEMIDKTFLKLMFRGENELYIIPEDIKAIGAHVDDGSQTRIYVSGLTEQLVAKDCPENVVRKVAEFLVNKKDK